MKRVMRRTAAALAAILAVSCTASTRLRTEPPPGPERFKLEAAPAVLVRTSADAESILSLFRPGDWCSNRMSSKACVLLSEYYAPFKHAPAECWQADESEEVLRCCTWEVGADQATDDGPDALRVWANEVIPTSTWCTSVEDPCRKWELGPDDGC